MPRSPVVEMKTQSPRWRPRVPKYLAIGVFVSATLLVLLILMSRYLGVAWSPYELKNGAQIPLGSKYFSILIVTTIRNSDYTYVSSVQVLSVSRDKDPNRLIQINPDFSSSVINGVDQVRLRNVMAQAKAKSKPEVETLTKAVESMIAVKLDRYIVIEQQNLDEVYSLLGFTPTVHEDVEGFAKGAYLSPESLQNYLFADFYDTDTKPTRHMRTSLGLFTNLPNLIPTIQYIFNLPQVTNFVKTDMSTNEWLLMLNGFRAQSNWQTTVLKINDTLAVDNGVEKLYQPQVINVDRQVQDNFALLEVIKEQARIEVYNGTNKSGLARKYQRFIENQGGKVIKTGNNPEVASSSVLYVSDRLARFPRTIELIRDVLRGEVIIAESEYPFASASDLVLVLGGELE